MQDAPRDRPVRLFLPGVGSGCDERGRPRIAAHGEYIGRWDSRQSQWIDDQTGAPLYPSQWAD